MHGKHEATTPYRTRLPLAVERLDTDESSAGVGAGGNPVLPTDSSVSVATQGILEAVRLARGEPSPGLQLPVVIRDPAATLPPNAWQQSVVLHRPEGVHAVVSFTVVPNTAMNLIAPRAWFPFGWGFFYSGGCEGSRLEVPGVAGFKLREGQGHSHAYLDLVRTPDGVTVKNAANRKHDGLRVYSFMVDSGAESSLVRESDRDIFTRTNEVAGLTVAGIGGLVQPLGGGFICLHLPWVPD